MNSVELKQWCVEKVVEAGASGTEVIEQAQVMFDFLQQDKENTSVKLSETKTLTDIQKKIINTMVEFTVEDKPVNGSALARHLDITQSYASAVLRKLITLGYADKEGNKYWAIRYTNGDEVSPSPPD